MCLGHYIPQSSSPEVLSGEDCAAFSASTTDRFAAARGGHTSSEPDVFFAAFLIRLIRSLDHGDVSFSKVIDFIIDLFIILKNIIHVNSEKRHKTPFFGTGCRAIATKIFIASREALF